MLGGSGTTAFEAAFVACVPVGATVVAAHAGKFGERWALLARRYGHEVVPVEAPGAVRSSRRRWPPPCDANPRAAP
jgi:aspartate aminotransferase-like enzyme